MAQIDLEQATGPVSSTQKERPWLFGLLIAPSAVLANGIVQGALSYLFRQQGVGIGRSSEIISLLILPTTIYFLWSPITDFWIARRTWLITGAVAAGLIMAAAFHSPRLDTKAAVILMFLSACFCQLVVASCGGMMGTLHSEAARRKASSFYQAGSLAFGAVAIFVMASLAQRMSMGSLGWVAAALIALPAFAALATPKTPREEPIAQPIAEPAELQTRFSFGRIVSIALAAAVVLALLGKWINASYLDWIAAVVAVFPVLGYIALLLLPREQVLVVKRTFATIWQEFKLTFFRWRALPYTLLMLFPMGSGAAIGLLPGIAQDYHVSGQNMAWMNGLGGAFLTAAGSLAATFIPTRISASVAYLCVCLINEATLLVLWLCPASPTTYVIGSTLYLFTIGTCYAMFTAVVLEFLGHSGKSGSGRYSIINSLGNVPVVYMTTIDGHGGKLWGARGLAGTDAVIGALGGTLLLAYFLTRKPKGVPVTT